MRHVERSEQRALAAWSLDCAERVLVLFEQERPADARPRLAIDVGRQWVESGEFDMAVIRSASLGAHAAARDTTAIPAACAAARAAGQAVATAHVAQHAFGGAMYALRAVAAAGSSADALHRVLAERGRQEDGLPVGIRSEVMGRIVVEERRSGVFVTIAKGPDF